jgi:hypothetical protein
MDSNPTLEDGELAAAVWDLRPIVDATGDEGASALITRARARAAQFSDSYTGQLAGLPLSASRRSGMCRDRQSLGLA